MQSKYVALVASGCILLGFVACDHPVAPGSDSANASPSFHATVDGEAVVLEGVGTATVDGVLNSDEWQGASQITFDALLPASVGGGTTPVQFFSMNDEDCLYVALKIERTDLSSTMSFEFDNDNDGEIDEGDDVFVVNASFNWGNDVGFFDDYRTYLPPCPDGLLCGLSDLDGGGTGDGGAAATVDQTFTYIEAVHPLDSDDDAHDFSLVPGNTVGFGVFLGLLDTCNEWPACFGETFFPSSWAGAFGDIVISAPVAVVGIDIMPGGSPNKINLASRGVTPVAVLSSVGFNATTVNEGLVAFGPNGVPPLTEGQTEDVNGDGVADLVFRFLTGALGLAEGASEICLTGETEDGDPIEGCDVVVVKG